MRCLVVVQKRSSLLICGNNGTLSSERELLAKYARDCNYEGGEEEDTHDDECEDPLEGDGMGEELANSDRGCKNAQFEANGIIL